MSATGIVNVPLTAVNPGYMSQRIPAMNADTTRPVRSSFALSTGSRLAWPQVLDLSTTQ